MSLGRPKQAVYLQSSPNERYVNFVELCRRLIGEYQYHDKKFLGELISIRNDVPIEIALPELKRAIRKCAGMTGKGTTLTPENYEEIGASFKDKSITRLTFRVDPANFYNSPFTRRNFCGGGGKQENRMKDRQLAKIYWRVRMRWSCALLNQALGQMIPELQKLNYKGFLLPNGDMVSFETMHFMVLELASTKATIFHFQETDGGMYAKLMDSEPKLREMERELSEPEIIESFFRFDEKDGVFTHHAAFAFNLPGKTSGEKDKLFVVDQTCAQFGVQGPDGGLVYWGLLEDYMKTLPAKKVNIIGYEPHTYFDFGYFPFGPPLIKDILGNLSSVHCYYCGEVENRCATLKKCSRCRNVSYCDALCQRLSWASHKLECHSNENTV